MKEDVVDNVGMMKKWLLVDEKDVSNLVDEDTIDKKTLLTSC